MPSTFDAALLTRWSRAAMQALERHAAELDRINVFPIPDRDTGTNLLLTMRSAADAARRMLREDGDDPGRGVIDVAGALARGALVGARGNSGMILSQVLRGVAEAVAAVVGPSPGGAVLTDALRRADRLATAAVARPQEGTVLSVLRAGATGAAGAGSDRLDEVAVAAAEAAGVALRATTGQLVELTRAGVVDAGGLGLFLVLDALAGLVSGRAAAVDLPAAGARVRGARDRRALVGARETGSAAHEYEVTYLLDGVGDDAVPQLRAALDALGDSVAVVGDGDGLWNVHVHCTDVGAAIEVGLAAGRPHGLSVVRFADEVTAGEDPAAEIGSGRFARSRGVLMIVCGADVAELARSAGADVLVTSPDRPVAESDLVAALAGTRARQVVLLPADSELTALAEHAASTARRDGQEVLVVPTASVLQGLAALAVHDPERHPGEDVVAMAEAAAGTRTGGLLVAETEALTWVGRCEPGDILGVSDGEVLLIAPDLGVGALWLAHRMLTAGGELVTALLGADVGVALGEGLAADLRRTHPEVDVVVHRGGQNDYPLVLGVE